MEINITVVSAARRHSTKHVLCWKKPLLCSVAVSEPTPTLPCFLLFSPHSNFLHVGIITAFPALLVQFLTCLLADVVAPVSLLPSCSCKPLFFCLFLAYLLLAVCLAEFLFPSGCTLMCFTGVGREGRDQTSNCFTLLHPTGNYIATGSIHWEWHCWPNWKEDWKSTETAASTPSATLHGWGRQRKLKLCSSAKISDWAYW